jgi:hypothetical protein
MFFPAVRARADIWLDFDCHSGLINSANFIKIHQNSVPLNFKISDFTVYGFEILKKYVKN